MKMEVFEYNICSKRQGGNAVAGTNDLEYASDMAYNVANTEHCDVDVINAFTGEVHLSLVCYVHIIYNDELEELERTYEVKEREW